MKIFKLIPLFALGLFFSQAAFADFVCGKIQGVTINPGPEFIVLLEEVKNNASGSTKIYPSYLSFKIQPGTESYVMPLVTTALGANKKVCLTAYKDLENPDHIQIFNR